MLVEVLQVLEEGIEIDIGSADFFVLLLRGPLQRNHYPRQPGGDQGVRHRGSQERTVREDFHGPGNPLLDGIRDHLRDVLVQKRLADPHEAQNLYLVGKRGDLVDALLVQLEIHHHPVGDEVPLRLLTEKMQYLQAKLQA